MRTTRLDRSPPRRAQAAARRTSAPDGRTHLTILHFAFEDHLAPGSGGGGRRTHEVNRRLAAHHRVITITHGYPGARRRVEDGVEYRHLGTSGRRLGRLAAIASYHLLVPLYALTHRADVVVEDFAAPMSSVAVPRFTRCPTVAVVQWLFAREVSEKYHVPFWWCESAGLASHDHFVAVSGHIAERVLRRRPTADVRVAYGGLADRPVPAKAEDRRDLLYLGRQQFHEKGLDLLLDAFATVARTNPGVRLVLAGNGPDEDVIDARIRELGLTDRIDRLGRVEGHAKDELLAHAAVVVMPSRFESFGLVAAEALAAETPVVAFSIPAMREIVGDDCGVLVDPFDVAAFAAACTTLLADVERRAALGHNGPARTATFDWDLAARTHEAVYLDAARGRAMPAVGKSRRGAPEAEDEGAGTPISSSRVR